MSTEPITPEARAAVERLLDGPVEQTERAAEDRAVRFLLDGLEVESIRELKRLVDEGRRGEAISDSARRTLRVLETYGEGNFAEADDLRAALACPAEGVLGRCPHGVDLDRDFCPHGCRV